MRSKFLLTLTATAALFGSAQAHGDSADRRSAYTYIRESTGSVTVVSELNGSVDARQNLPISAGDVVRTEDPARSEIALADGNLVQVGGGTEVKFVSLSDQQGSDDEVSAMELSTGSVILSAVGGDERSVPRIDTDDVTVYGSLGSRVRVNADERHGTSVIVRAGSVEVRTKSGSYTVRAGNYLTVRGDEEPEIARGDFSHDRFDGWAADRLQVNSESSRSASSRYVDEEYSGDVQALDNYGDWDYSSDASSYVWRPRVSVGWTPYSSGSWYYTPAGLTWWSSDPWGWYPFHYGNWFFDAGFSSWCWSPGYLYSPAWVYWGYTSSYLGWCPVGNYGGFSPWWNDYYRRWSYPRSGLAFAVNGNFSTRRVDFRGWNFTGNSNLGTGRMPIVAGSRIVDRLGGQLAISSRPIIVNPRAGGVRDSLREFAREAPRTIGRSAGDSSSLEPFFARDRKLPEATVAALRDRAVVADRGRLSGPGAREIAPRGAAIVERNSGSVRSETIPRGDRSAGRPVITNRAPGGTSIDRSRPTDFRDRMSRPEAVAPQRGPEVVAPQSRPGAVAPQSRSEARDSWRSRSGFGPERTADRSEPARPIERDRQVAPSDSWRGARPSSPSREEVAPRGGQSWRSRSDVPPARRVIEGAVPRRRAAEGAPPDRWSPESPRDRQLAPRDRRDAPPVYRAEPRREAPPAYRAEPRRDVAPREQPRYDRAPSAPPPQSAPRSAPPARSESRSAPSRSSAPSRGGSTRY